MEDLKNFEEFLNEGTQEVKKIATTIKARKFVLTIDGSTYMFDKDTAKDLLEKLKQYADIF